MKISPALSKSPGGMPYRPAALCLPWLRSGLGNTGYLPSHAVCYLLTITASYVVRVSMEWQPELQPASFVEPSGHVGVGDRCIQVNVYLLVNWVVQVRVVALS